MILSFPNRTISNGSPVVEYSGAYTSFPAVLETLRSNGISTRFAEPTASDPQALTLYFHEGDEGQLQQVLQRKSANQILVVSRAKISSIPEDSAVICFTHNDPADGFEIARCIYLKAIRLRTRRQSPSAIAMRRFFRYAVKLLS
ncbi:MAG: hypothetical protein FJX92_04120 [Bacteroidetes bacterium]|nr:hypothetical protein [Bacteroidota bacterium]